MKSRIPFSLTLMLVVLALSFVPAASIGTQSAAALPACDWAQFVADVTVPDGTTFAANQTFTKTWRLKNIGFCTWTTSYALVFDSGNSMGGPTTVNLPTSVAPGQTVDVSVDLTAPSSPGHYIGYWKLMNASGVRFGIGAHMNKAWWVEINVGSGSSGVAYDFAANYCDATWFSTAGNLPCPGSDGDPRGFVLKVDNPQLENGTNDSGSGLITQPRNIFNGDIHGKFPAFHVEHGDKFQSIINCSYGATGCYVTFRLDYQIGNGPIYTYWAFREKYEGLYYRANVDLNPLAGKDVKFILTVLASGPAGGDRALWSNPAIVRVGPPAPPPASGSKFDFGTGSSPVAPGYIRVTEGTTYPTPVAYPNPSPVTNYGWVSTTGLESRDRSAQSDPLKRDLVNSSSNAGTFQVDIPNGYYAVTVTMGDQDYAHDNMVVKANGVTVLGDVDSAAGSFTVNTFNVNVTGGNLQLEFSDGAGPDLSWVINAITIVPTTFSGDKFDFGTASSPVAAGYTQVTGSSIYSSGGFGWDSAVSNVDRGAPSDDLKTDLDYGSPAATFRDDIPDGFYAVTVTMGDNSYAHDMMIVRANGAMVLGSVDSAAGSFTVNTFNVNVTGGALELEFSDGGGSDGSWVVNAITITPITFAGDKFDFGTDTSPLELGYTQVTEASTYSSGPFGWTSGAPGSRDRTAPDALKQDFATGTTAAAFRDDVPNGNYAVTVTMGDQDYAHDNMVVKANGATVLADVDSALGGFTVNTFNVSVTGGNLQLEFSDGGGTDGSWVVNAVTIIPTSIPSPPPSYGCDRAQFVADVTVPDGTVFPPGASFVKVWRLRNVGTCTWNTSYKLVFDSGDQMGGPSSVNMPTTVAPGHTVDVSVNLVAPSTSGTYRGYWKFQNDSGTPFGIGDGSKSWWVEIRVFGWGGPPWHPGGYPTPMAGLSAPATASTYENSTYGFSFELPPGSTIVSQSDSGGRVDLPFTEGTNLVEKFIDVNVEEGQTTCKSPATGSVDSSENVTLNGVDFLEETGSDSASGETYDWTGYSTTNGNACISLTFVLHSSDATNYATPPTPFDQSAESAVFPTIMSSFQGQ